MYKEVILKSFDKGKIDIPEDSEYQAKQAVNYASEAANNAENAASYASEAANNAENAYYSAQDAANNSFGTQCWNCP